MQKAKTDRGFLLGSGRAKWLAESTTFARAKKNVLAKCVVTGKNVGKNGIYSGSRFRLFLLDDITRRQSCTLGVPYLFFVCQTTHPWHRLQRVKWGHCVVVVFQCIRGAVLVMGGLLATKIVANKREIEFFVVAALIDGDFSVSI